MASTKNLPPMARPNAPFVAKFGSQDLERNKVYFNVHHMHDVPSNFFGPEGPADPAGLARDFRNMRLLTSVKLICPNYLERATDRLFDMMWADERNEDDEVTISKERYAVLLESIDIPHTDISKCLEMIESSTVKASLKENVANAVSSGAFGLPFIVVNRRNEKDQVYFGSDRFEQMATINGWKWYGPDPALPSRL